MNKIEDKIIPCFSVYIFLNTWLENSNSTKKKIKSKVEGPSISHFRRVSYILLPENKLTYISLYVCVYYFKMHAEGIMLYNYLKFALFVSLIYLGSLSKYYI